MDPASAIDYKSLISKLIKKQLLILGPDITFVKVKNVAGLTIDANGNILGLVGDPKAIFEALTSQFIALSGSVVKQTLDAMHSASQNQIVEETVVAPQVPVQTIQPQSSMVNSQQPQTFNPEPSVSPKLTTISTQPTPPKEEVKVVEGASFNTNVKEPPKFTVEDIEKLNSELERLNSNISS